MLIYTETHGQNILIGTQSNLPAIFHISSNQTSVYGNIVPYSNGTFSLGTPSLRFKDLFLTGATLDIGGVQLKLDDTSNNLSVKTSDGEYTRIIAKELQLGSDSNSVVVKIDSNNSIQFVNVNTSNVTYPIQWSNDGSLIFTENTFVGINTSNPQYDLDVNGDINLTGNLLQNGVPYIASGISSQWSNTNNTVYILDSNVGIGMSNPAYNLDVAGSINFTGDILQNGLPYTLSVDKSDSIFLSNSNISILDNNKNDQYSAKWAGVIDGAIFESANATTTDVFGNVFVVGDFEQSQANVYNFDGSSTVSLTNSSGTKSAFLVKYSSNGNALWAATVDGPNLDSTYTVASDTSGNVFIGAYYDQLVNIYNANFQPSGISLSNGYRSSYVVKYDTNGIAQWALNLRGSNSTNMHSVQTDSQDNLFVVGSYTVDSLPIYNADGSPSTVSLRPTSGSDSVSCIKFDSNGNALFAVAVDGTSYENAHSVAIDSDDNIYLAGSYSSVNARVYSTDNSSNIVLPARTGYNSGFVVKFDSAGVAQWATAVDRCTGLAVQVDSKKNVYLCGNRFEGPTTIYNAGGLPSGIALGYPPNLAGYVVKWDSNGNYKYHIRVEGPQGNAVNSIFVKPSGELIMGGYYRESCVIYEKDTQSLMTLPFPANVSSYVVRFDTEGKAKSKMIIDGAQYDSTNWVHLDNNDNMYIAGAYLNASPVITNEDNQQSFVSLPTPMLQAAFILKCEPIYFPTTYYLPSSNFDRIEKYIINKSELLPVTIKVQNETNTATLYEFEVAPNRAQGLIYNESNWYFISNPTSTTSSQWSNLDSNVFILDSNVGIGTSNPTVGFQVAYESLFQSNVTIMGDLTVNNIQYITDSEIVNSNITTLNTLTFSNQTGSIFLDSSNGNLGINTSTPEFTLDVNGDINFTGDLYKNGIVYNTSRLIPDASDKDVISNSNLTVLTNTRTMLAADWAVTIDDNGAYGEPYNVATDTLGNTYVIGITPGSSNFIHNSDNTSNLFTTTSSYYFLKLNSNGIQDWIIEYDGNGYGTGIATDHLNNVYVASPFVNSAVVLNANGSNSGISVNGADGSYIVKYDPNGVAQWAITVDGTYVSRMLIDEHENLYLACGHNFGSPQTLIYNRDNTLSSFTIEGDQYQSSHIIKYDSNGFVQWTSSIDATSWIWGLNIDQDFNIYYSGDFSSYNFYTLGLQPIIYNSDKSSNLSIQNTNEFIYLVKLNSNGICQWAVSTSGYISFNQAIDSHGNIYLPMYIDNTTNNKLIYDSSNIPSSLSLNSNYGVYLIKYNTHGQSEWVASVNTTSSTYSKPFVCVDKQDNLYLQCYNLPNSVIYDINNIQSSLDVSSLPISLMIVKYDSSGIAKSYVNFGDGNLYVTYVSVDNEDNIVLVGGYSTCNVVYNTNNELSDVYLREPDAGIASYILKYQQTPSTEPYYLISSNAESLYKHMLNSSTVPVTVKIQNSNNTITLNEFKIYPSQVKSLVYHDSNWHITNPGISYFDSSNSSDQIFVINSNVGINNTSPQHTLDVNGDINFTGTLQQYGIPFTTPLTIDASDSSNIGYSNVSILSNNSKLSPAWAACIDGVSDEYINELITDKFGNIYVTGMCWSTAATIYNALGSSNFDIDTNLNGSTSAFLVKYNSDGIPQWGASIDGPNSENSYCIATDDSANVYIAGYYSYTATIYNTNNTPSGLSVSSANGGTFIVKYDSNGTAQWAINLKGPNLVAPLSLMIDDDDNIFLSGYYSPDSAVMIYDADTNLSPVQLMTPTGNNGGFVIKFNSNGVAQWALTIDGPGEDFINYITTDTEGNLYLAGGYTGSGSSVVYCPDGTSNMELPTSPATTKAFIVKCDSNGTSEWFTHIEGDSCTGDKVKVDSDGNVYMSGRLLNSGATIFHANNVTTTSNLVTSQSFAGYVCKWDSNGYFNYSIVIEGSQDDVANDIHIDDSKNLYVCGFYQTSAVIYENNVPSSFALPTSSNGAAYTLQFNPQGIAQNIFRIDGLDHEGGGYIDFDQNGNMYMTMAYTSQAPIVYDIDNNPTNLFLVPANNYATCLIKYAPSNSPYYLTPTQFDSTKYIINTSTSTVAKIQVPNSTFEFNILPQDVKALMQHDDQWYIINRDQWTDSNTNLYIMNKNVGINNSNPQYTLDVVGDGNFTGDLHVFGDVYADNNVYAFSDSNYKKNIVVIPNALDKIDHISGYTFSFNEDPTAKRYAGLLAQEVQNVLPEVVSGGDSNERLSVAYGNTVALLVNAIKELRSEVKSLKENLSNKI